MDRWRGRTAVVTGAGAGMGAAIAAALAALDLRVIALEINDNLVKELQKKGIVARQCDISKSDEIAAAFQWIEEQFGGTHILVNNAGVLYQGQITDIGPSPLSEDRIISTLDTNTKGVVLCSRHAVASMNKNGFNGHIININSLAGHYVPLLPSMNVYSSTKYGVSAFSGALLNELAHFNSAIKVTSISPGATATALGGRAAAPRLPALRPRDIADAVVYVLSTPAHVNISELTIQPVMEKRL